MAFLVFEGIDASGKSTLLKLLCKTFEDKGLPFIKTREPGGNKNRCKNQGDFAGKAGCLFNFFGGDFALLCR